MANRVYDSNNSSPGHEPPVPPPRQTISNGMRDMNQTGEAAPTAAGPEAALIAAIAKGDATAVKRLYALTHVRLFRYLVRTVRNEAAAEDVMNEVYLAVWQNAARYEGRSSAMTWLLSIAHNKAVSSLRKRREATGMGRGSRR